MKVKTLLLTAICLSPLPSFASDGDITFEGQVVASACSLNGFNGGTTTTGATMTLPSVTPSSFAGAGGYAGMTDFTIDLKNCDITTLKNARVSFSGTVDGKDGSILNNASATSPATGVGVAILEKDGTTKIDINSGTPSASQALSTGTSSLLFKAAYKANTSDPTVTAGSVSAKTFIDITYH